MSNIYRLFAKRRPLPDDDFAREMRREQEEAEANMTTEELVELERQQYMADLADERQLASKIGCPSCGAKAGEACGPGWNHYERRAAYARL